MKRIVFTVAVILFALVSCKKDSNAPGSINDTAGLIANNWKVSSFINQDLDETKNLEGYTFLFDDNGGLIITKGAEKFVGTWSLVESSNFKFEIQVSVSGNRFMDDIDDNWFITRITGSEMQLQVDGNSKKELFFYKI